MTPVELVTEIKKELDATEAKGATALFVLHREPFEMVPTEALEKFRQAFARIHISAELCGEALAILKADFDKTIDELDEANQAEKEAAHGPTST